MTRRPAVTEERKRRRAEIVARVDQLERVENALAHALAELPTLLRELQEARRALHDALQPKESGGASDA